jgi:hypothetical protein
MVHYLKGETVCEKSLVLSLVDWNSCFVSLVMLAIVSFLSCVWIQTIEVTKCIVWFFWIELVQIGVYKRFQKCLKCTFCIQMIAFEKCVAFFSRIRKIITLWHSLYDKNDRCWMVCFHKYPKLIGSQHLMFLSSLPIVIRAFQR